MPFTFYAPLDQNWIDNKVEKYDLCKYEILDELKEGYYNIEQIIDSPNPVIRSIIYLLINQLIDRLKTEEISQKLQEKIRDELEGTVFINSIDSHLSAYDVFDDFKRKIRKDFKKKLARGQAKRKLKELENLFDTYQF
jgi:adenine-specific DNA methylase